MSFILENQHTHQTYYQIFYDLYIITLTYTENVQIFAD